MTKERYEILIVDDDPQIHKLLGKMLSQDFYSVSSAFSADEAFIMLKKGKPDLVVLDLMMPKVSGIEVLSEVRNDKKLKDILVLILSAKDAQDDRLSGLSQGADDYVAKPFHMKHLVRKIEHMIQKRNKEKRSLN